MNYNKSLPNFEEEEGKKAAESIAVRNKMRTQLPEDLSQFRILEVLGQGTFGVVFKGEVDIENGRVLDVAIKMIYSIHEESSMKNELKMLQKFLDAPHILQLLWHFVAFPSPQMLELARETICHALLDFTASATFFVVELFPFTLEKKLEAVGNFMPQQIIKYSQQLAKALRHLFRKRVVHRDVKLDNIFVTSEDSVILGDLGVGLEVNENYCCDFSELCGGNQLFAAPEVLTAINSQVKDVEASTEINFEKQYSWELGCVIYYIAVGQFPFNGYPGAFTKGNKTVSVPEIDITNIVEVDEKFAKIISQLLVNDPQKRISIEEAYEEISCFTEVNLLYIFFTFPCSKRRHTYLPETEMW